jgi:hypothetical protein
LLCAAVVAAASACGSSPDGGSGTSGSGGDARMTAFLLSPGADAILEVRIEDAALGLEDEDPARWQLRVAGTDVPLAKGGPSGVLAMRSAGDPQTVEAVYIQARVAASAGVDVVVDNVASGRTWSARGQEVAPLRFPVHPVLVHDTNGGGTQLGGEATAALSDAWEPIRKACGVELEVAAARSATLAGAGDIVGGVQSIDDAMRPADLVVPKAFDALLELPGLPEDELRIFVWPGAKAVGLSPEVYELAPEYFYRPTLLLYDAFDGQKFVGAELSTDRKHRFALASDTSFTSAQLKWTWSLLAIHEIGHLLGFTHPDQTTDRTDDFVDNWMAGAHSYPNSFGRSGSFPSVTARQCILLRRDLNGFARPRP